MASPMTVGETKQVDDVIFTCTKDGEADAHSVNDTGRERIVKVKVAENGHIVFPEEAGKIGRKSAASWEDAAKVLTEYVFQRSDKNRDNITGLRREYDALPTYQHSMKKQGNVILNLTADGHVQARSFSDTAGADTAVICYYEDGQIRIGDRGSFHTDWASAIAWLSVGFDEYEANKQAGTDLKAAFGNLPDPD